MRRATACVLLLVLAALAGGCGSDSSRDEAAARARARAARQARLVAAGRGVFARNCADCHTIEGRVAHPTFIESPIPDFNEVRPKADYVHDRVERGGFDMPSFSGQLPSRDFDAVVAYVVSVAGSRIGPLSRDPQQLAMGEQVFRGNCERCHAIAGRRATATPTFPGTDFNRVKPSEALVMRQLERGIQEAMPSFRHRLSREQRRAVAAYVTATAGE